MSKNTQNADFVSEVPWKACCCSLCYVSFLWNPLTKHAQQKLSGLVSYASVHTTTSVLQSGHTQTIFPLLATRCWAPHEMETHLSNNASVVMRVCSQYRSRTINMRRDLKRSPLLRQRGWPSTWLNSISPSADTTANLEREEREKTWERQSMHVGERWGRQGGGEDRFSALPQDERPEWNPEKAFWRFTLLLGASMCRTFRQSV